MEGETEGEREGETEGERERQRERGRERETDGFGFRLRFGLAGNMSKLMGGGDEGGASGGLRV
jgi:hypothetical protein